MTSLLLIAEDGVEVPRQRGVSTREGGGESSVVVKVGKGCTIDAGGEDRAGSYGGGTDRVGAGRRVSDGLRVSMKTDEAKADTRTPTSFAAYARSGSMLDRLGLPQAEEEYMGCS
eukprot:g2588.t1